MPLLAPRHEGHWLARRRHRVLGQLMTFFLPLRVSSIGAAAEQQMLTADER